MRAHTRRRRTAATQGYLLLMASLITFLMLCCSHSLCWSSSRSFSSRSLISALRHLNLSTTSVVLQPAPTPLQPDENEHPRLQTSPTVLDCYVCNNNLYTSKTKD